MVEPISVSRSWPPLGSGIDAEVDCAEGCELVLVDGRRILDATGGAGAVNVGYGNLDIVRAMTSSLKKRSHVLAGLSTEERVGLLDQLSHDWLPPAMEVVHLVNSGSEAFDCAAILARHCQRARGEPERWRIVGRNRSYHGTTLAALGVGGHDARRSGLGPLINHQLQVPECDCSRCPLELTYPQCDTACARALEDVIEKLGKNTVAAFVAEPVVGASGGALVPPPDYWRIVREICDRHRVLLVVDEVMTGFGRTGHRFAIDAWQVEPDLILLGKGISGGYAPLGGIAARRAVAEDLRKTEFVLPYLTTSAHPAACAASREVLNLLMKDELVDRAARIGATLGEALKRRLSKHEFVSEVRGLGLLWAVQLAPNQCPRTPTQKPVDVAGEIRNEGLREGVLFYPAGTAANRDTILLTPPFIVTDEEIERISNVLLLAIDRVLSR